MTELADERAQVDFVMWAGDYPILELSGTLLVEEQSVDPGQIQFWIERPKGKGGGFQVTQEHWVSAHWLPTEERTKVLEIRMKNPVFSLRVHDATF